MKNALFLIGTVIIMTACQHNAHHVDSNRPSLTSNNDKEIKTVEKIKTHQGIIKFFSHEGGFFGIVTKHGQKLFPINLNKNFQQDGAIVELTGHIKKDVMSFQQWGKPFHIKTIKLIKAGKKIVNPDI